MPDDELDRELRAHLELEAEELGDPHAARRAFGNLTAVREAIHEMSNWRVVEQLLQDLRYGVRLLGRSPAFSIVAVLTLALGIGANTAIFTVVNAVLLRPLPYPQPDRLVRIWETKPSADVHANVVNPLTFLNWQERTRSFEHMAAITSWSSDISGEGNPLAVDGMRVSPDFFAVLGVPPFMGRTFIADDGIEGRDNTAILSYAFWQTHYAGDPHILGRKIMLNGSPVSVVGVLPRDFRFPNMKAEIWVPMAFDRTEKRGGRFLTTVARLKPGVSLQQAQADLEAVARQIAQERPEMNKDWSAEVDALMDEGAGEDDEAVIENADRSAEVFEDHDLYRAAFALTIWIDQLFDQNASLQSEPAAVKLATHAALASAKLAAALSGDRLDEIGMTIAYLKRALKAITVSMEAAAQLRKPAGQITRSQYAVLLHRLFQVRDGIISLMGEYRGEWLRRFGSEGYRS